MQLLSLERSHGLPPASSSGGSMHAADTGGIDTRGAVPWHPTNARRRATFSAPGLGSNSALPVRLLVPRIASAKELLLPLHCSATRMHGCAGL
jgi:hypothetical protein